LRSISGKGDGGLALRGWRREKVLALVIKLVAETRIRFGNQEYVKRSEYYGLVTLRKKHVDLHRSKMKFEFVGKRGKKHSVGIRNKKLVRLVNRCLDIPGWELFQWIDAQGQRQSVNSAMVNQYLREIVPGDYTAKDFRTWGGSVIFFNVLRELGCAHEGEEIHKNLLYAFDAVAKALGNTRTVCRKYYVHPLLVSSYGDASIQKHFESLDTLTPSPGLSLSETALLKILKGYRPEILDL